MSLERFVAASELFDAAGSPSWCSFASAIGVRWRASTGRLPDAEQLLTRASRQQRLHAGGDRRRRGPGRAGRGTLGDVAHWARDELEKLEPPNSSRMLTFTRLAYESVARVAFFSGDRDVLAWAAAALSEAARSRISRRIAAVAAAHLSVLDGADADRGSRERSTRPFVPSSAR